MIDFETWWNSSSADEFRRLNDDMDGRVVRPVWDAAIRATLSSQKATSAAPSPEASQLEKSCGQCRHRHQDGRLGCARENCHGRIDWEPATQPPSEREVFEPMLKQIRRDELIAEIEWCLANGTMGHRTYTALAEARAALATQPTQAEPMLVHGVPVHGLLPEDRKPMEAIVEAAYAHAKKLRTQPTQAEAASVTTSQTVDELIAYAAQEREKDAEWQQWVERGGYDGDQQTEAPSVLNSINPAVLRDGFSNLLRGTAANLSLDGFGFFSDPTVRAMFDGYQLALATQQAVQGEPVARESGIGLAVIGRRHFGNPIPPQWYDAARELIGHLRATHPAPGQVERDREDEPTAEELEAFRRKHWMHWNSAENLLIAHLVAKLQCAARSSEGGSNEHSR